MAINNNIFLPKKIDVQRALLKHSLFEFIKFFWHIVSEEKLVANWHIEVISKELEIVARRVFKREPSLYDLIINVPPSTSKSTIVSQMFPVWCWINDPSLQIGTTSYSKELSIDLGSKSRDIIKSKEFSDLFPEVELRKDIDNKGKYKNTKKGFRFITSTGGTVTGIHFHIGILDDNLSATTAASEAEREKAHKFSTRTFSTRTVGESTIMILVEQRLHVEDTTSFWLKSGRKVKHFCFPAELNEFVYPKEYEKYYIDGLFDPIRLSRVELEKKKLNVGSYAYSCQFLQNPIPEGGSYFKKNWFNIIDKEEFVKKVMNISPTFDVYVDTAETENLKNDASGIIKCWAYKGNLYIFDFHSVYFTFPDLRNFIVEYFTKDNGFSLQSRVFIEGKSNGISVVNELKQHKINAVQHKFDKSTGISMTQAKEVRAMNIQATVERGVIYLVEGYSKTNWITKYLDFMCAFPHGKNKEATDVTVMAMADKILPKKSLSIGY